MTTRSVDRTEAAAGILFMLFALFFGVQSFGLDLGTAFRMGPGYFPLVLSGILLVFGLLILASAFRSSGATPLGPLAWRGLVFILPAPVLFGLTVRGLGFVPSIFLTTLVAALASLKMRLHWAVLLAVGVTIFSTLVFSYALGLPFRRFGPWLGY